MHSEPADMFGDMTNAVKPPPTARRGRERRVIPLQWGDTSRVGREHPQMIGLVAFEGRVISGRTPGEGPREILPRRATPSRIRGHHEHVSRIRYLTRNCHLSVQQTLAQFWFGSVREANEASPVDIGGQRVIKCQIPDIGEARRVTAQMYESTRLLGDKPMPRKARTRLRVTWETPLGTVRQHDTSYQESDLITEADDLDHLVFWVTE